MKPAIFRNVGIVVLVLLALWALLYALHTLFVDPLGMRKAQMWWSGLTSSSEVKNATYLLAPWNAGMLYKDGTFNWAGYASGRETIDYDQQGDTVVAVMRETESKQYEIFLDWVRMVESGFPIRSVAISPDESGFLYAKLRGTEWSVGIPHGWELVLRVGGLTQVLGPGFMGSFLDENTIARVHPDGIVLQDIDGSVLHVYPHAFKSAHERIAYTADRSLLAITIDGTVVVYAYDSASRTLIEQNNFTAENIQSIEISHDALYVISVQEDRGAIMTRYTLDGSGQKVVRTFSPTVAPVKMVLDS